MNRTEQKLNFILETEKLKAVLRKNKPLGLDRYENTAEHSWQATLTALIFLDDAPPSLDRLKILKMLIIHDLVEIDAGDVMVYDEAARAAKAEEEQRAAVRLFGMLPNPLGQELLVLWQEFEAGISAEAKFARAFDRVNPALQNLNNRGQSWVENGITRSQVLDKNSRVQDGNTELWEYLENLIKQTPYLKD